MDREDEPRSLGEREEGEGDVATPTPRRTTFVRPGSSRLSDVGISNGAIPVAAAAKRLSFSRLPAPTTSSARMSLGGVTGTSSSARGGGGRDMGNEDMRPSSSKSNKSFTLAGVGEDDVDVDETF